MNDKKEVEQTTEAAKQQAANEAKSNTEEKGTVHTINPFTGTEVTITPEDLEGIEKKIEADTERD